MAEHEDIDKDLELDPEPEYNEKGKKKPLRKREWFFTLFPISPEVEASWLSAIEAPFKLVDDMRFITQQVEKCPNTGKIHMHIYVQFKVSVRFEAAKKIFPNSPNVGIVRNAIHARDYCNKVKSRINGPWQEGEFLTQGQKINVPDTLKKIQSGMTDYELIQDNPSVAFCPNVVANLRSANAFRKRPPLKRTVTTYVLWGPPRTGKTHRARMYRENDHFCCHLSAKNPFDEYDGQSVLVIDEFDWRGTPIQNLNRMLDDWDYIMPCRYRNKHAFWDTVFICANTNPDDWYRGFDRPLVEAFRARITKVYEVLDKETLFDFQLQDVPDFMPADNYE